MVVWDIHVLLELRDILDALSTNQPIKSHFRTRNQNQNHDQEHINQDEIYWMCTYIRIASLLGTAFLHKLGIVRQIKPCTLHACTSLFFVPDNDYKVFTFDWDQRYRWTI